jgi:DNA-binding transcriptional MerR regulator
MNNLWQTEGMIPGKKHQGDEWERQRIKLFNIIHRVIDIGFSIDEVKEIALDWNRNQKNPFPDWDVIGMCKWAWRKWAQNQSSIVKQPDKGRDNSVPMNNLGSISNGSGKKPLQPEVPYQADSKWQEYAELFNLLHSLIESGLSYEKVLSITESWSRMRENPSFPESDAMAMAKWAWDVWATKVSS